MLLWKLGCKKLKCSPNLHKYEYSDSQVSTYFMLPILYANTKLEICSLLSQCPSFTALH